MRILFVSSLYPSNEKPQYCIFLEQQALALKKRGHEVDILVVKKDKNGIDFIEGPYLRNDLDVYLWFHKSNKISELLLLPAEEDGIKRFLYAMSYDVVSMHFGSYRQFETIANVCRDLQTSVFMHYHGLNVWKDYYQNTKQKILQPYTIWRKKRFLDKVDAIVGVSDCTCDKIKEYYKKENVFTVYNGVDCELFKGKSKRGNPSVFLILCVANLIPIKRQLYLLRAVEGVLKKYPVELLLVGEGADRQSLEEEAIRLGIRERVDFLGVLPYDKVVEYMSSVDMFVMPSYFEAFGCVYIEAMACGTLTCGCKNNGAQEIISDKIDGLLVDEKSVEDIQEKIIWAIENPKEAHRIAERGRKKVKQFSWDASAEELLKLYEVYCK